MWGHAVNTLYNVTCNCMIICETFIKYKDVIIIMIGKIYLRCQSAVAILSASSTESLKYTSLLGLTRIFNRVKLV